MRTGSRFEKDGKILEVLAIGELGITLYEPRAEAVELKMVTPQELFWSYKEVR